MSRPQRSLSRGDQLLLALAEELKLPLLQIARQAELAGQAHGRQRTNDLKNIEQSADQALWLVDSYLLSLQLQAQPQLELEPVAVPVALQDVAHQLDRLARQYNCQLEVQLDGRFAPVMAHRQGLQAALVGLGSSLITAAEQAEHDQLATSRKGKASKSVKPRLVLAAHRSHGSVVTGVYSASEDLTQSVFERGRGLLGRARQPLHEVTAQTAAGVFVADSLLGSMNSRLRVAKHHQLSGLAATLQPSHQLKII